MIGRNVGSSMLPSSYLLAVSDKLAHDMRRVGGHGRDHDHQRAGVSAGAGHERVIQFAAAPLGKLITNDENRAQPVSLLCVGR